MNESRSIALWTAALIGAFGGALAWRGELAPLVRGPAPSPVMAASPAQVAAIPEPLPEPIPVTPVPVPAVASQAPAAAAPTPSAATPRPAPERVAAPVPRETVPAPSAERRARNASGDNPEARRYTDALNALAYQGYSGVESIAPEGEQLRAVAIMQDRRVEVLIDPASGAVQPLGGRR